MYYIYILYIIIYIYNILLPVILSHIFTKNVMYYIYYILSYIYNILLPVILSHIFTKNVVAPLDNANSNSFGVCTYIYKIYITNVYYIKYISIYIIYQFEKIYIYILLPQ
jgi:hypothetical protein